jgi:hypothetical protein
MKDGIGETNEDISKQRKRNNIQRSMQVSYFERPLRLHNELRTRGRPVGRVRRLDRHHGLGKVADLDLRRDL